MLNVEDADFEQLTLKVRHAKGGKQRLLPLEPVAVELAAWIAVRPEALDSYGQSLFPTKSSTRISTRFVRTRVKQWGESAGVAQGIPQGLHPHALRHTVLTLVYQATKDIRAAQEVAGHSSPAVTAIYARVDLDGKREALAAALRPKNDPEPEPTRPVAA